MVDRHRKIDSRSRPMFAEAVFPSYLVQQTMILLVAFWLLATPTSPLARFLVLAFATAAGR